MFSLTARSIIVKWVLFVSSFLFFAGCATIPERDGGYIVNGYDFTPYVEKGFYFSPNTYNGKYVTMGTLDILYIPEVRFYEYPYPALPKGWRTFSIQDIRLKIKEVSTNELLDKMYNEALKLKGNGIMDFRLTFESDPYYSGFLIPRFFGTVIKIVE